MALKPKLLSRDILVCVTNYDFSEQADALKSRFARKLPTILIDSSSPTPPKLADRVIENSYYPGLWNEAVRCAGENRFKWLMFVASDLQIPDVNGVCRRAVEAIQDPRVGIWTPSLHPDSRTSYTACINKGAKDRRECGLIEGFFFLAPVDLLAYLYPIEKGNRFGWGIDLALAFYANRAGLSAMVDDRVTILHPRAPANHEINEASARQDMVDYFGAELVEWGRNMFQVFN